MGVGNVIDGSRARVLVAEGARLVDVRSPEEFATGCIEGAVNIPVGQLDGRIADLGPKTGTIVLYCQTGVRSARAAAHLHKLGYPNVFDLGPISMW